MVEIGTQSLEIEKHNAAATRPDTDVAEDVLPVYLSSEATPIEDLAFEEQLLREEGPSHPALFLYRWRRPALVIGRGQSLSDIDEDVCRTEGIVVVRRKTGGTAVLHNPSVNVALVLPSSHAWASSIAGLYTRFVSAVSTALRQLNIAALPLDIASTPRPSKSPICFEADSGETLALNKRKVFGCAQHRKKDAVLVHGTLLLGLDVPQHSRVFKVPEERIARSLTAVPREYDPRRIEESLVGMISTELAMTPVRIGAQYDG